MRICVTCGMLLLLCYLVVVFYSHTERVDEDSEHDKSLEVFRVDKTFQFSSRSTDDILKIKENHK